MRKSALYAFGLVVTMLVALGLVILSSASGASAARYHGGDVYFFLKRQAVYIVAGLVLAAMVAWFDYHRWRDMPALTWIFYGAVFLLLLAVFPVFGGRAINGSYRWIQFGPVNLQPGELAKLATVVAVAVWMDRAGWKVGSSWWRGAVAPALIIAVLAGPVMREPDFGSTMVIGLAGLLVMLLGGTPFWWMVFFCAGGGALLVAKVMSNPNRMARIAAFFGIKLNIGAEVLDTATKNAQYQGEMALAAIGHGGVGGVGLTESMQKWDFLPEAHTDMIFAIGAEELGLLFSIGVILLFVLFFVLALYIARNAADRLGRNLVMGMTFVVFFAAIFNLGVVCEALPMKGMALPFFSYGGTNMLSAFFAVGTILSVGIHSCHDHRRELIGKVVMRAH